MMFSSGLLAADINYTEGGSVTVEIDQHLGSMLELPYPVKVIPATKNFEITPIQTEATEEGAPINVTILNIKPVSLVQVRETVPIILDGGRTIKVTFVTREASDRHHRIIARKQGPLKLKGFLEKETYLMVQMLRDEEAEGYQKTKHRQKLSVEGYKEFDLVIVRKYEGQAMTGYVFQMINKTDKSITINPTALNFSAPSRAALLQMDHETLSPCRAKTDEEKINPCASAIRVVIRGKNFSSQFRSKSDLPFFLK